jgi:hypothetical protein
MFESIDFVNASSILSLQDLIGDGQRRDGDIKTVLIAIMWVRLMHSPETIEEICRLVRRYLSFPPPSSTAAMPVTAPAQAPVALIRFAA